MPLARADSSNLWAVPRLCSMNAAPKPRPRMETSAPVRPSRLRSTSRESVFAKFEVARALESSPPMPAPNKVRRMNSRRDVPASISQESLWTDPASMDGAQVQSQLRSLQDLTRRCLLGEHAEKIPPNKSESIGGDSAVAVYSPVSPSIEISGLSGISARTLSF